MDSKNHFAREQTIPDSDIVSFCVTHGEQVKGGLLCFKSTRKIESNLHSAPVCSNKVPAYSLEPGYPFSFPKRGSWLSKKIVSLEIANKSDYSIENCS
jgi:hypothetical protein